MPLTTVEISKSALKHNIEQLKAILPPDFTLIAVIKANAYGHEMTGVAEAIKDGVSYMAVSTVEDGLALRESGIDRKLLIMGNVDYRDKSLLLEAVEKELELSVFNLEMLNALQVAAAETNRTARIHIKVDTGMRRFGVLESEALEFIEAARNTPAITIQGLFSHLGMADEESGYTEVQESRFRSLLNQLSERGISIPLHHLYNSPGSMRENLLGNACRIGISLYGLYPSNYCRAQMEARIPEFSLRPVLSWKTRIVQVNRVPEGSPVSYGGIYRTKREETLAILPTGHFDGYDRGLSNKADVLVRGKRCPVAGRVCMNQTVLNVSGVPGACVGDEVVLLGKGGEEEITAEELADKIDTVVYEIVTRINPSLPRVFL
ncbi:MAG: alanine racemase [Candidatus Poribacteria bacterium]|nr:alanine racemase [Candidatus Poribacteria bacterium]